MTTMGAGSNTERPIGPKFGHPRPDFGSPPVEEVVLSVQFEALTEFGLPHFGLLWSQYRGEYPKTEDKAPLSPVKEEFGTPKPQSLQLQIVQEPAPQRCWFVNENGTELVQVQRDRFVVNWRRTGTDTPYPRYEHVRERFLSNFRIFETFLHDHNFGEISPTQCEVTYVNHLPAGRGWKRHGQFKEILSVWSGKHSDRFLPEPEDINVQFRYNILSSDGEPIGRLHIVMEPRIKLDDASPLIRLALTARGAPLGKNVDGIVSFFDLGREYVVRGFASVTSRKMHRIWERTDDPRDVGPS